MEQSLQTLPALSVSFRPASFPAPKSLLPGPVMKRIAPGPTAFAALLVLVAPTVALQSADVRADVRADASTAAVHAGDDASAAVVDRVIALGRDDNRVQEHLDYLTNGIGPRLTSSTNLTRACQWAAAQLGAWGLDARIEKWGEFAVGFDAHGQRGGMVHPERIEYVYRTPAWSPGTPGPVRGPAILEPATLEELAAIRDRLPGAWIVRTRSRPKRTVRNEIEAALDAAAIAGEVRRSGMRIQVFGNRNIAMDDLPTRVSIWLRQDQWEDLFERLEGGADVELEFDVDNRFLPGPIPLYNVVADIPGTELPDEYVVVGGHIDSWHAATGTNDNGTGVATTMEAARLLMAAGARPKRTIRFMLWSGEEQGLLGSRGYVEQHPELMPKISAALVHDMGTNYLSGIEVPAGLAKQLEPVFAPVMELDPEMPFEIEENEGLSRMAGSSDHASFLREGVPGLFWQQAGRSTYGDFWHTHFDTFDSAIPEYQQHSAVVVAVAAYNIANLDVLLERDGLFREGSDRRRSSTRRRMGVYLDENEVVEFSEDGSMAEAAGWESGDVILAIDGVAVSSQREVVEELQKGGPKKTFKLQRGEETIESVLDFTGTPSEKAREEEARRAREEAEQADEEAGGEKKDAETTDLRR